MNVRVKQLSDDVLIDMTYERVSALNESLLARMQWIHIETMQANATSYEDALQIAYVRGELFWKINYLDERVIHLQYFLDPLVSHPKLKLFLDPSADPVQRVVYTTLLQHDKRSEFDNMVMAIKSTMWRLKHELSVTSRYDKNKWDSEYTRLQPRFKLLSTCIHEYSDKLDSLPTLVEREWDYDNPELQRQVQQLSQQMTQNLQIVPTKPSDPVNETVQVEQLAQLAKKREDQAIADKAEIAKKLAERAERIKQ